jgi:hypothetical protein
VLPIAAPPASMAAAVNTLTKPEYFITSPVLSPCHDRPSPENTLFRSVLIDL